jgi:hypothetical protein
MKDKYNGVLQMPIKPGSDNAENARKLWKLSEEMTDVIFPVD